MLQTISIIVLLIIILLLIMKRRSNMDEVVAKTAPIAKMAVKVPTSKLTCNPPSFLQSNYCFKKMGGVPIPSGVPTKVLVCEDGYTLKNGLCYVTQSAMKTVEDAKKAPPGGFPTPPSADGVKVGVVKMEDPKEAAAAKMAAKIAAATMAEATKISVKIPTFKMSCNPPSFLQNNYCYKKDPNFGISTLQGMPKQVPVCEDGYTLKGGMCYINN